MCIRDRYKPSLKNLEGMGALSWLMFINCLGAAQGFTGQLLERIAGASDSTPEKFEEIFKELDRWVKDTSEESIQWNASGCELITPDLYAGFYTNVEKWISQCIQSRSFATTISASEPCHDPEMAFSLGFLDNFFVAMGIRIRVAAEWVASEEANGTFGGSFD